LLDQRPELVPLAVGQVRSAALRLAHERADALALDRLEVVPDAPSVAVDHPCGLVQREPPYVLRATEQLRSGSGHALKLTVEGGLALGNREPALIQGTAHDDADEALEPKVAQRAQIVDSPDAARVDEARGGLGSGGRHLLE